MMKLTLKIFICNHTFLIHQVLEYCDCIQEICSLKLLGRDIYKTINKSKELWNWYH